MSPPSVQRHLDVLLGEAVVGQLRYTQDCRMHQSFQGFIDAEADAFVDAFEHEERTVAHAPCAERE